ncbi:MAG: DUF4331 domain-containing protein [Chloroflexota bacterium]
MNKSRIMNTVMALLMVLGLAAVVVPSSPVSASSHREAPLISQDPAADNTDLYAFVSPDLTSTVTLIANYVPMQQPQGGPNFYRFGDDVDYEINLDTTGGAFANITYRFRFHTTYQTQNTFLYNIGPVTSLTDPDLNIRQYYSVERIRRRLVNGQVSNYAYDVIANNVQVAPANIGPRSTPNYSALGNAAISNLTGGGGKVFAGPRDDPFWVDLGSAFDLLGLRPLNSAHLIPLTDTAGVDGVAGYNVNTIALQVPISTLELTNGVVGVWAGAKRMSTRVINGDGTYSSSGPLKRVSRLGMPLVNEVIIPLSQKDKWNSTNPAADAQFGTYVANPEIAGLINALYPPVINVPTTGRTDLVAVFLTGIPGLNQLPTVTPSEMIRLNTTIPPSANPNRLGVVAGDNAGFPNGRRLADDVVEVELRAIACSYGVVGTVGPCDSATYNQFPNNALTDGVDANDKPFLSAFPYVAEPWQGYEAVPPTSAPDAVKTAAASLLLGAGTLIIYRSRRSRARKATATTVA